MKKGFLSTVVALKKASYDTGILVSEKAVLSPFLGVPFFCSRLLKGKNKGRCDTGVCSKNNHTASFFNEN